MEKVMNMLDALTLTGLIAVVIVITVMIILCKTGGCRGTS